MNSHPRRGAVVKLDDLAEALEQGVIGGAGLDVFEVEPLPEGHPIWGAPNTILTPHVRPLPTVLLHTCVHFTCPWGI